MTWRDWRSAIEAGNVVFLVGAGISVDPPAGLPVAPELSRALAIDLSDQIRLPDRLRSRVAGAISRLRPEVLGDILVEHLGSSALNPVSTLLRRGSSNRWHVFLAQALGYGCSVVTTNFDTLIEEACELVGATPFTVTSSDDIRDAAILTGGTLVK